MQIVSSRGVPSRSCKQTTGSALFPDPQGSAQPQRPAVPAHAEPRRLGSAQTNKSPSSKSHLLREPQIRNLLLPLQNALPLALPSSQWLLEKISQHLGTSAEVFGLFVEPRTRCFQPLHPSCVCVAIKPVKRTLEKTER